MPPSQEREFVEQLAEEFLQRIRAGEQPSWQEYAAKYPEHAELIGELFPTLVAVEGLADGSELEGNTTQDQFEPELYGMQIGPYKLLQKLGAGGMGVVFMAEQKEPIKRRVALKIIKPGMDSRQVVARFEAERQALAMMDHPNIAKVLDVGSTDEKGVGSLLCDAPSGPSRQKTPDPLATGRPYFVMELVMGVPITRYCDEHHLTLPERLALFVPVCQAIQHAHQKGIIHRDLKPSNVLVAEYDFQPVPKIIDFGLAKALHQPLTDKTMFTQFGQIVGTWAYMSPEQARLNQLDIDTRSDIYSLGVLLYELLTGHTPFDQQRLRSAALEEVLRIIREEEPPRPSAKLSGSDALPSVAASRGTEPARLTSLVRTDLDLIVMKAIDKERGRRYETANSFAEDVGRYLHHEPIQARPPSAAYRTRKFIRRNRTAVTMAGVVLLSLVAGMIGTTYQWWQTEQQRARAEELSSRNQGLAAERQRLADEKTELADREEEGRERAEVERIAAQSRAVRNDFPIQSALLAAEAVEMSRKYFGEVVPAAHEALLNATSSIGGRPLAHNANIVTVAISPDGRWVVTGSEDNTAQVWDLAAPDPSKSPIVLKGHTGSVASVAVSPDCRRVATASADGKVLVWNLAAVDPTASPVVLDRHTGPVISVAFSSTGRLLVTGSTDNTVRVWDLAKENPNSFPLVLDCVVSEFTDVATVRVLISPDERWVAASKMSDANSNSPRVWDLSLDDPNKTPRDLKGHQGWIQSMAISSDSRWLITGENQGRNIRIWDLTSDNPASAPMVIDKYIRGSGVEDLAISPNGRWLATAADRLQLWDLTSDAPNSSPHVLEGHEGFVMQAAISADGRSLATGGRDRTVRVWHLSDDGAQASHLVLRGHEGQVLHLEISSDGRWLVSVGFNKSVARLWDLSSLDPGSSALVLSGARAGPIEPKYTRRIIDLAASQDGRWLVTGAEDGSVRLWDLESEGPARSLRELTGLNDRVVAVSISGNGRWVIAGGEDGHAILWDLSTQHGHATPIILSEHSGHDYSVGVTPNGRWAVTASSDEAVRLWDLTANYPADAMLELPDDGIREKRRKTVCVSPDSRWLVATGFDDLMPRLWDLTVDDPASTKRILRGNGAVIWSMAFDANNRRFVAASHETHVWDFFSGNPTIPIVVVGAKRPIWKATTSPDGRLLATSEFWHTTQIHDLSTPDPTSTRHELSGFHGAQSLAISPDGKWLAAGSIDGTARLWELGSPTIESTMRTLRGHKGSLWSVTFSANSRWLITGGDGGKVILWPLDVDGLLDRARRAAGRELTEEERVQFSLVKVSE